MAKKYRNEEEVKNALKINNFREISKEKLLDFVSMLPNVDKEVALAIVNQFPSYGEMAGAMVTQLKSACDAILDKNENAQKAVIEAYRKILDDLGDILKRENISEEERNNITAQMIEVADKISNKDTENKHFLETLLKGVTGVVGGVLLLAAAVLGVNSKKGGKA